MRTLTYTFVALILPLVLVTRRQAGSRRAFWAVALAAFAVSALHLSQLREGGHSWPIELLGHHASIPLALAILYEDFPFALADLFLKRALTLMVLIATAFGGLVMTGWAGEPAAALGAPSRIGALVVLWVGTALLYPFLRRGVAWFVDTIVLARPDYRRVEATIARRLQSHDQTEALLTDVCALIAPALSASAVEWHDQPIGTDSTLPDVRAGALNRDDLVETVRGRSARVLIPVSEPPGFVITIRELAGGRQLLSDDVSMLASVGLLTARRIDAIRLTRERDDGRVREQEMSRLATEAELRALRSQINPHFLFNALTTIGYLIQAAPDRAVQTLMRLTSLLRAVLRSEGEFTTLGREVDLIESYLDIERARFEQRLQVHIDVPVTLRGAPVPALVLQPVVENAIKHGIAPLRHGGELIVTARLEEGDGPGAGELILQVEDTGRGATAEALAQGRREGVGLNNVERRLAGHYGAAASLAIRSVPDQGTRVTIRLPAPQPAAVLPFGRQKP
jgi:signal transduction histidine kinase